jgi:hypothetical protein
MADNVAITAGAGTTIATEDESGVHYQVVKLAASGSGTVEGLSKAEDSAAASGEHGIPALAVRRDTAAVGSGTDGDYSTINVDGSGRLWVNASGAAVPVTDNSGSLTVDNGGTFAVQATLEAGTAAFGKLSANSGVDIGDVDVTSVTPGTAASSLGKAEDGAHASGDVGVMALAVRQSSPANTSGTNLDYEPLQIDSGLLWTRTRGIQTPNGDSVLNDTADSVKVTLYDASGVAIASGAEYTEGDTDTTISGVAIMWEDTSDTLRAVSAAKPLPVATQSIVPGTAATNLGKAEDAAHTSADTGVYVLAVRDDAPAAHSGTDGDYESLHVSAEGSLWTSPTPSASGGLSIFRSIDLDETEEEVKATAGTVYACWVTNTTASTVWLKFYNATAANTTVGTTTPVITIGIPGNASDDISANFGPGGHGIGFSTAISVAATTGVADNDTGAPAANALIVNIFYK